MKRESAPLRLGELFAGYGGLGLAVEAVFGAQTAWVSEIEDAPSRVLAHRFPDAPNHGDITKIDWGKVEPVDILSGGFPCQDVSLAGRRAGLGSETRTGLWAEFARAIDRLKPAYVVAENVRGLLSARADSDMEQCQGCMGEAGAGSHYMRALGAVLADLADLGYDAGWQGIRASDVGAPHQRFRVVILAHRRHESAGDTQSFGVQGVRTGRVTLPHRLVSQALPDGSGTTGVRAFSKDASHTKSFRWDDGHPHDFGATDREIHPFGDNRSFTSGGAGTSQNINWGIYEPAIKRGEITTGRSAPAPTQPTGRNGAQRLSPSFVEWMMGLPDGWVTDPKIWEGLTDKSGRVLTGDRLKSAARTAQLKMLGNGVHPLQAAVALDNLLRIAQHQP